MEFITSQLLEEAIANINIAVVIALMAVGFIIKHVKFLEKVENNLIPPILLVVSILIVVLMDGFTVQSIISAIINAAVAVGLHQQGKNIFTITVVPSLGNFFKALTGSTEDTEVEVFEEEAIEETVVEEV